MTETIFIVGKIHFMTVINYFMTEKIHYRIEKILTTEKIIFFYFKYRKKIHFYDRNKFITEKLFYFVQLL
jgi:hypothetical protein